MSAPQSSGAIGPEPTAPVDELVKADTSVELAIEGMHCESCVALIEEVLGEHAGVHSANVDLAAATAVVRLDPSLVGVADLQTAIAEVGYSATPAG